MFRVKICGVTTPDDATWAAACGADAVGLNFYPNSPRYLAPERACAVAQALPESVARVGVFVAETAESVNATAARLGLTSVQTYTNDPPDTPYVKVDFIPAFRVRDGESLEGVRRFVRLAHQRGCPPAAVLVDSHTPGELGGTGHKAPWHLLFGFDPGVPVILAGGLTPENVSEAIRQVRPHAVDVASGVESSPGRKDPGKVRAFVQAACSAFRELLPR